MSIEAMGNDGWKWPTPTTGSTESERYLARLARKAFLSLWSYPNVFTDEGRRGNGDGKELCDLVVVFGDDVLLFSDKHCQFPAHPDIRVAWNRWYKRAIHKSATQLAGAEAWVTRFPERLYLDSRCETKLPIKLPPADRRRIYLIAVTRGAATAAQSYWGGDSSGSLMLDTSLVQGDHQESPFRVGWVLPKRRFVHVLDEITLDVVLREFDTASDLVTYLKRKEERLTSPGIDFLIPGEEELVANYLANVDLHTQRHYFPDVPTEGTVVVSEGCWRSFLASDSYRARRTANEISYLWDQLIEFQNNHIIGGTAEVLHGDDSPAVCERVMRTMAQEDRLTRRNLGASILRARTVNERNKRFTRTVIGGTKQNRAYIFLSLPPVDGNDYDQYRDLRKTQLLLYCYGCKLKFEHLQEIVGIAFAPVIDEPSVDFFLIDFHDTPMDPAFAEEIREQLAEANMWNAQQVQWRHVLKAQFPNKLPRLSLLKTLASKIRKRFRAGRLWQR